MPESAAHPSPDAEEANRLSPYPRPAAIARDSSSEMGKRKKKTHWLTPSLPPCSAQQVGVSNDVMLASKGSAFMEMTIHGLVTFNHDYVSNYPTVMFTTG